MYRQLLLILLLGICLGCSDAGYHRPLIHDLGCWKDSLKERVIPDVDQYLLGRYGVREDAIEACARYTRSEGYETFASQDGRCKTGPRAIEDFRKLGPSFGCLRDGKGGVLANQVYTTNFMYSVNYRYVGCYNDNPDNPAIPTLEKRFVHLHDDFRDRKNAIKLCANSAISLGYKWFALQAGGQCMSAEDAGKTYWKYGPSHKCGPDYKGGEYANSVFEITDGYSIKVYSLGCFKHDPEMFPSLEDTGVFDRHDRNSIIEDCIRYSAARGVQKAGLVSGHCHGGKDVDIMKLFNMRTMACPKSGEGAPYGFEVYNIVARKLVTLEYLGCWADDRHHAIPSAEGRSPTLSDKFKSREFALEKCGGFAYKSEFTTFALQDGGECFTSNSAGHTFSSLGPSERCQGYKGGPWANSVWRILDATSIAPWNGFSELRMLRTLQYVELA